MIRTRVSAGASPLSRSLALLVLLLMSGGSLAAQPQSEQQSVAEGDRGGTTGGTIAEEEADMPQTPAPEEIAEALHTAYPHRITRVSRRDGDVALQIDGEWLYYAEGRFLPEQLRYDWEAYDRIPFYRYPQQLPEFSPPQGEMREHLQNMLQERSAQPPRRHPQLYNAIWNAEDEASAYAQVKTTYFLGVQTMVHRDLLSLLAAIEADIMAAAQQSQEVRGFVDSLASVEGYSFRRIADTASLSFHSYGAAIDLVPQSYQGRSPYWLWASQWNPDWYDIGYDQRYMLPQKVVGIFEEHGFIWGGKWLLFDTIHFEYRPEILLMNGAQPAGMLFQQRRYRY